MDPFRFAFAFAPLAAYFISLGVANLRRRPVMVTGVRDTAFLGFAVAGLVTVGPASLFVPTSAVVVFGSYVWFMLVALMALTLTLVLLLIRPRLVVYNITSDELRAALADIVVEIDPKARWAGDSLTLPTLGVQAHLDRFAATRNVSLISSGGRQSQLGWQRLEGALRKKLATCAAMPNPLAGTFLAVGWGMMLWVGWSVWNDSAGFVDGMRDLFFLTPL